MTAETRGSLLGERQLQRSLKEADTSTSSSSRGSFQFPTNLSDTFTKSASSQEAAEAVKPFKDELAKQERFEQFLKEKYKEGYVQQTPIELTACQNQLVLKRG